MNDRIKKMFEDAISGATEKKRSSRRERKSQSIDPSEIPGPIRDMIENEIGVSLDDVEIRGYGSSEEFEHCGECDEFERGERPTMEDIEEMSSKLVMSIFKEASDSKTTETVEIPVTLIPEIINTIMISQIAINVLVEKGIVTDREIEEIASDIGGLSL
jgi:hypothetical protein